MEEITQGRYMKEFREEAEVTLSCRTQEFV